MELVKFALKFRVTFYVMAVLIAFLGIGAIVTMPKDVLPNVDIPVVSVIWTYTGLDTTEMEQRVTTYTEFVISNNVNGIRNIESQTLPGVVVEKVYMQPDVSIDLAIAQVVAVTNTVRAVLPPGIQPPIVVRYSASSVPVIQLALSSNKESEQQLYDYGQYRVRQAITSTPGTTIPSPFGGKLREIMVDLDLHALQGLGLSPSDVVAALSAQNLTEPSGQAKLGNIQYPIELNATPTTIAALNRIPVKVVNGTPVLVQDVAYVRDGYAVQQNIVRQDGRRAALLTILKNGNASTLSVVNTVKSLLPGIRAAAPKDLTITPLFDQSAFVSSAISDVLREGAIAAALTGLMILLFLGSWRSTLVVLVSIPLSILVSLAILGAMGETLNIMTLGGLALAVGILVDDATVAIENTYRLMENGEDFRTSVVHGAAGIAKPALISTLSICAAFISVLFLTDAARYIFTPQALAVVFAMLASYGLSRTIVPILIDVLVKTEFDRKHGPHAQTETKKPGLFGRIHAGFERGFESFRQGYSALLHAAVARRRVTLSIALGTMAMGGVLVMFVGEDYFPQIDAGQMTLHVRGPSGLRIEETERLFQQVEDVVRQTVPDASLILDNIGLPANNYNLAFSDGSTVGLNDGQILISLKPGHPSTFGMMKTLRVVLRDRFPNVTFYFQPADIITQVLNFGVPAPIDVQVSGKDRAANLAIARQVEARLRGVRGAVDVHLQQIVDAPEFFVDVDRIRAAQVGLTEQAIATTLNTSLSSSYQVSPNFWTDPTTGIPYQLAVQTPEYRTDTLADVQNTPMLVSNNGASPPNLLANVATLTRRSEQTVANHENTRPTYDVYANLQDRPLGGVESDIGPIVHDLSKQLLPGDTITLRGQILSKNQSFARIGLGLAAALVLVYLLMAVNFQSWGDPLVVLLALPLAFCGIVASLFITQTTLSIPSLMGAIMSVGVASANSILLVTFAREHREQTGCSAVEAAIAAGETRLRPVLMTAGAMFVGLIPMALGLGDGSEQNAALARAVLGGVAVGTCSTLLFVPFLYATLRTRAVESVRGLPMTDEPKPVPRRALATAGIVAAALLGWGAWGHYRTALAATATQQATLAFVPTVQVAVAQRQDGPVPYTLPGTISAFDTATLFARATGYVAERRVDIGSRVKQGELLLRIAAPDLDQQLAQANATLMQTQASLAQSIAQAQQSKSSVELANVTNGRTSVLADQGWETRQDADNTRLGLAQSRATLIAAQAAIKVAQANLAAQYATVQRLQQLTAFENVTAPFDGVITSRSVDTGDLVSDTNGTGNVLFTLVRDDVVRVQVSVPQSGAIGIRDGLEAKVHVPELPDQVFEGRVTRSAVALAQASRTMQSEVDVPNPDGVLRPGLYVTVDIGIPRTAPGIVVPAEAILFNGKGLRVAVVKDDGTVRMQDVSVYRDYGTTVELRGGLNGGERVVLSPPAELGDGSRVKVPADAPKGTAEQTAQRS